MKLYFKYFLVSAALLALTGCAKDPAPTGAGEITIVASIGATKVSTDGDASAFESGDRLALYAWTGGAASVPDTRVVNGVVNTFDGTKWTPASPMIWGSMTTPHYFLGISPDPGAITSFTAWPYTLDPDPAAYAASDLLVATNFGTGGAGVVATGGAVSLPFTHVMALLRVNLKFRSEWATKPAVGSVTVQARTAATVNFLTQTATVDGTVAAGEVPLTELATPASGYGRSFSGLQVPQTFRRITVNIGGKAYVYESTDDISLTGGAYTTVNLNVGKDRIVLDGISVSSWTDAPALPEGQLQESMLHTPLTLEATEDGTTIAITNQVQVPFEYAIDGGARTPASGDVSLTLQKGQVVQFFSTNPALSADNKSFNIKPDKKCYVYGNVMSLIDDGPDGFAKDVVINGPEALKYLFWYGFGNIAFHPEKRMLLPATTLSPNCYERMFGYCTGLTSLPEGFLPATTLAENCYLSMFEDCDGLTTLPAGLLPATTLAPGCYQSMFYRCGHLTETPVLPDAVLASSCYNYMFNECASLEKVTCLATSKGDATDVFSSWLAMTGEVGAGTKTFVVNGCFTVSGDATTALPQLGGADTALWGSFRTDSGIPKNWTVVPVPGPGTSVFIMDKPGVWD